MADSDGAHNCRKCGIVIGNHNKYLHDGMCDECFFSTYAPEERPPLVTDEKTMKESCKANEEESTRFMKLAKSGSFNQEEFDRIVSKITKLVDCKACGRCCKELSFAVSDKDVKTLAEHLKITEKEFMDAYTQNNSEGALELKGKPCIFLKDSKCSVYDARPEDCRSYPHLDKPLPIRMLQFFANAEICPIAFNALEEAKYMMLEDGESDYGLGDKLDNFNPDNFSVRELCKEGTGMHAINNSTLEAFVPIFVVVEGMIANSYAGNSSLKDSDVIFSLKKIRDRMFSKEAGFNAMEKDIIDGIKAMLFINDYCERDVSMALSWVIKSTKLHKRMNGSRGYLDFILDQFARMQVGRDE